MKIYQSWKRNEPDTVTGYSITITVTCSSFDESEIDDLQKKMPKGTLVINTKKEKEHDPGNC